MAMKVIIFGNREYASLTWYMLTHDSPHEVVGFTVDNAYVTESVRHGLPVIAFEEVEKHFPPETIAMIAPLGAQNLNRLREEKHHAGKAKGYRFISYVSSRALIWPDLTIGENCVVSEASIVQPFAKLGNSVVLSPGSHVGHHVEVGDNCFLSGDACIGGTAKIGERCFLGLNSTIRNGITVSSRCFVAAGAVVTADTEQNGIYVGVPAKRRSEPADSITTF